MVRAKLTRIAEDLESALWNGKINDSKGADLLAKYRVGEADSVAISLDVHHNSEAAEMLRGKTLAFRRGCFAFRDKYHSDPETSPEWLLMHVLEYTNYLRLFGSFAEDTEKVGEQNQTQRDSDPDVQPTGPAKKKRRTPKQMKEIEQRGIGILAELATSSSDDCPTIAKLSERLKITEGQFHRMKALKRVRKSIIAIGTGEKPPRGAKNPKTGEIESWDDPT